MLSKKWLAGGALLAAGAAASVIPGTAAMAASPPPLVVVVMENHSYSGVVGSSAMPYFNSLWSQGQAASGPVSDYTQMYAVTHPSLPNYLAIVSGSTQGQAGGDKVNAGQFNVPSLWDQLTHAGVPWGVYQEGMPSTCYQSVTYDDTSRGGTHGQYVLRHNPATVFAPIFTSAECSNVQPLSSLPASQLPQVSFVTPNLCDDAHGLASTQLSGLPYQNCLTGSAALLTRSDQWLQAHVPAWTAAGADVLITWDEGTGTAGANGSAGGGQIASLLTGPGVSPGSDSGQYSHYSVLAGIENLYRLPLLGQASSARPLPLPGGSTSQPLVNIGQPAAPRSLAALRYRGM